ncbi:HD-GYP domain-containing protein [Arcobacter sp.]|uniref:HD-GYP domain-containing protein n=1 Tax=Arcobacter sp. TaxID=1872629 RepID=UPI003D0BCF0A
MNNIINTEKIVTTVSYERDKLIKISPKILFLGESLSYSIYKENEENIFNKFLGFEDNYDKRTVESLETENIENLYIKHEDFDKYSNDINKYLFSILNNKENTPLIKSELMHELANDTMQDLLVGEVTKNKINHISEIVSSSVDFILNDSNALKSMIEVTSHDYCTYTHSVDVSTYALAFGAYLGLSENQLKSIGKGAMLHDLGKKNIPLSILNKKGKLSDEEFEIMKNHPSYGVDILREMGEEEEGVLSIVEQHHEKINGKGYPKGLEYIQIHPFSQIVAICDIFNALTTKRSYKEPMSSFEAIKLMYVHMKDELNLKLLAKFINFLKK